MKVAVISDIHSNIDALDAVLADIEAQGIETIYCTGDQVGYLPFPNEVIDRIYEKGIICIQGNHDEMVERAKLPATESIAKMSLAQLTGGGSRLFTQLTISEENRAYMDKLPESLSVKVGDLTMLLLHGSPERIDEYVYEDNERFFEFSTVVEDDIIVYGHTHIPYHKYVFGKHFVNAGSVGKPKHGSPDSTYVIIEVEGKQVTVTIREVPYDRTRIIEAIRNEALISDKLIDALEEGK